MMNCLLSKRTRVGPSIAQGLKVGASAARLLHAALIVRHYAWTPGHPMSDFGQDGLSVNDLKLTSAHS